MEWWAAAMEEVEGRCKEGRDDLSVLDVSVRRVSPFTGDVFANSRSLE